jgi:hypothetical protein
VKFEKKNEENKAVPTLHGYTYFVYHNNERGPYFCLPTCHIVLILPVRSIWALLSSPNAVHHILTIS